MIRHGLRRPALVAFIGAALTLAAMLTVAGAARAQTSLNWSPAIRIDGGDVGLRAVACPSAAECVTVDGLGQVATFDPQAPPATPAPVTIEPGASLSGVACPSATQCTAVDSQGDALTFDPTHPAPPTPLVLDAGVSLSAVACPTAEWCVAVGPAGDELTFDPLSSVTRAAGTLGSAQLWSVACPGAGQCTAVDADGTEWTFDPSSPATAAHAVVDSGLPSYDPAAVACPSAVQCTVAGSDGKIETFDPTADPAAPQQTTVSGTPRAISCPETDQCTVVADGDLAYTFDPTSPGSPAARSLPRGGGEGFPYSVACPSADQCTSVDTNGPGVEVTFDPAGAAPEHALNGSRPPVAVACVSTTECTSVDDAGEEIAYDPSGPAIDAPGPIDPSGNLAAVACPAGQATCVAVDGNGAEVTYDPLDPAVATVHGFAVVSAGTGVSCPASDQCTFVDARGLATTFDPATGGQIGGLQFIDFGTQLNMIACPSTIQCTAIDADGDEFTWNPTTPAASPAGVAIDGGRVPSGLACPTTSLCVAVDPAGDLVAFNPTQATSTPHVIALAGTPTLTAVACPSAGQCTALTQGESAYTFDPAAPGVPTAAAIGSGSLGDTTALACASTTQCTATDASTGGEVTFNPHASQTASVDTAMGLTELACPSSAECITVDRSGNAIAFDPANVGTPAATAVVPVSTSGYLVSCPTTTECVTLGGVETPSFSISEEAAEFDPTHPSAATPVPIAAQVQGFRGLACPTASLCAAVQINGNIVTFDPADPGAATSTAVTGSPFFTGLSCPSASLCAAVALHGTEVMFDLRDPAAATASTIDGGTALDALACVSVSQCTALDANGNELTFDPADPGTPTPEAVGSTGPIACLASDDCVASGSRNGLLEGDPVSGGAWRSEAVPDGSAPLAVACPTRAECVELDSVGNESTAGLSAPELEGLSIALAGSGTGTVSSSPAGIDCGSICFAQFDHGQVVTLTPSPSTGSIFAGWSGGVCSGMGACQVTMGAAESVTAAFTLSSAGDTGGPGDTGDGSDTVGSDGSGDTSESSDTGDSGGTGNTGGTGGSGGSSSSGGTVGTDGSVASASVPTSVSPPAIAGTPQPNDRLTCSQGSWSVAPTGFTYQWKRAGQPIAGATGSTYVVQIADEALTLTCTVTAANASGSAPATSAGTLVAIPGTLTCAKPTGDVSGASVGPLKLGMTEAVARKKLKLFRSSSHNGYDNFCLYAGFGIRAGYPTALLLSDLKPGQRRSLTKRVVIALTPNRYYALDGVRPGAAAAAAVKHLHAGKAIVIGLNTWYLVKEKRAFGVLKVQHGEVIELGLANRSLLTEPSEQRRFLSSFKG